MFENFSLNQVPQTQPRTISKSFLPAKHCTHCSSASTAMVCSQYNVQFNQELLLQKSRIPRSTCSVCLTDHSLTDPVHGVQRLTAPSNTHFPSEHAKILIPKKTTPTSTFKLSFKKENIYYEVFCLVCFK